MTSVASQMAVGGGAGVALKMARHASMARRATMTAISLTSPEAFLFGLSKSMLLPIAQYIGGILFAAAVPKLLRLLPLSH